MKLSRELCSYIFLSVRYQENSPVLALVRMGMAMAMLGAGEKFYHR